MHPIFIMQINSEFFTPLSCFCVEKWCLVGAIYVCTISLYSLCYSPFSILIGLPQCGQALFPVLDLRFQLLQLLHILPVGFDSVSAFSAGIELFIDPVGESVFLLLANGTGIG